MTIRTQPDLAVARNQLRKFIVTEKGSPTTCARAIAALAVVGEYIIHSEIVGTIEATIADRQDEHEVLLSSTLPVSVGSSDTVGLMRSQLDGVVNSLEIEEHGNELLISIRLVAARSG